MVNDDTWKYEESDIYWYQAVMISMTGNDIDNEAALMFDLNICNRYLVVIFNDVADM